MIWEVLVLFTIISFIAGFFQVQFIRNNPISSKLGEDNTIDLIIPVLLISSSGLIFGIIGSLVYDHLGLNIFVLENLSTGNFDKAMTKLSSTIIEILALSTFVAIPFFLYYYTIFAKGVDKDDFNKLSYLGKRMGIATRIFSGGFYEEIVFRFGLLSLMWWFTSVVLPIPENYGFWIANILSSLLFGLAHLPGTESFGIKLTRYVVLSGIVLNGIIGILFGYLFLTYGLYAAMISHSTLHIIWVIIMQFHEINDGNVDEDDNSKIDNTIPVQTLMH